MANTFKTSQKTELVALRAAESAAYLTVGSKKFIKDDLKNKRNGKKYQFVIADNGEFCRGIDVSGMPADLKERTVEKVLKVSNQKIKTNLLEPITDMNWDVEAAIPNGKSLIENTVADAINGVLGKEVDKGVIGTYYDGDLGMQDTAFAGIGYGPFASAYNYLNSISDEDQYFFIHPMINSKLSVTGKSFDPTSADPIFSKGLLGTYSGQQVRACRELPLVHISAGLSAAVNACTSVEYADAGASSGIATITFGGVNEKFPKGSVVWFNDVYACDLIGLRTSENRAFVAIQDSTENGVMIVRAITEEEWIGRGTRSLATAAGEAFGANKAAAISAFNTAASNGVRFPEAGNYFGALVRLNGSYEFETLDAIDASNAETEHAVNEGLHVFMNRGVDVLAGTNVTRWTTTYLAGIVEPRAVSYMLIKDANVNLVKVVND